MRQGYSVRLDGDNIEQKRLELREYFLQSYTLFESLFDIFVDDSVFYRQSEPTRHHMIFYFGHTSVFYINKLLKAGAITDGINSHFEHLFAVGVDEMSWDADSGILKWPSVDEVRDYRARAKEIVLDFIATHPLTLPVDQDSPFWAIWMGIEHERIHIETSSVLHRQMPLEFIKPQTAFSVCNDYGDTPKNEMVFIDGKTITLGKGDSDSGLYGWDNEYGIYSDSVEGFRASKYLVSNGEFLEFVRDGGYENREFWDAEGQKFLDIKEPKHPIFWIERDGRYLFRLFDREIELPLNHPVEVNALEAEAFCRYKSQKDGVFYMLPSESQWRVMLEQSGMDSEIFDENRANINLAHYASSVAVDRFSHGKLYDVVGNVWQWTSSQMDGFDWFKTHYLYDDFSTPTFDGKHNLIKGGSWISTGNEMVRESRYAFRRHFPQHAGFRYVIGTPESDEAKYKNMSDLWERWSEIYG